MLVNPFLFGRSLTYLLGKDRTNNFLVFLGKLLSFLRDKLLETVNF